MNARPSLQAKLGAKIRELRVSRGLSVRTLAARTGFSPSFISHLELEAVSPSISSLERIAAELGISLSELFGSIEATPRGVIRKDERTSYESAWSRSTVTWLADVAANRALTAVEVAVAPGGASGRHATPSPQEAFALVLSGAIVLTTEAGTAELREGDAAYLAKGKPLSWENRGEIPASLLIVGLAGRNNGLIDLFAEGTGA